MQTLIVSSDGTQAFAEMAPAAAAPAPMPGSTQLAFITRQEHEAALGEQRWREVQMQQNPSLFAAREKLERAKKITAHYSEIVDDLARRRVEAEALAIRGRSSVFYEDYLRPQGLNGDTPLPGRENRLNALTAELDEAKQELQAAIEEQEAAQLLVTQELAKVKL